LSLTEELSASFCTDFWIDSALIFQVSQFCIAGDSSSNPKMGPIVFQQASNKYAFTHLINATRQTLEAGHLKLVNYLFNDKINVIGCVGDAKKPWCS
jgi:hypothetical protein